MPADCLLYTSLDAYTFDKQGFARDTVVPGGEIDVFYKKMSYLFPGLKVDDAPYTKAVSYTHLKACRRAI